jgi:hypothetical protein
MKIKLTHEQIDLLVLTELKQAVSDSMADPWALYHDMNESMKTVQSLIRSIEYFSTYSDYKEYIKTLDWSQFKTTKEKTAEVDINNITENEDGSANVDFTISEEYSKILIGEGFKFLLIKAAINKTDEEITKAFM